jgi:pimeloyl-ACP methyl ester carboxylesterase
VSGSGRRWPRRLALVALAGLLLGLLPPVRAYGKAAAVLVDALDLSFPRPFAEAVVRTEARIGGVRGHLYAPERPVPAVLLVPGATPAGLEDRRAIAVAEAYARAGRAVFMPELVLYQQRFDEADIDAIVRAVIGLAGHEGTGGSVTLIGFSYGGSFALVAAADPRLDGLVDHVGVFGAYHDLIGVVQAATAGVSLVDGERIPWAADPAAEGLVREHAIELAPANQRSALASALAGELDPVELSPETQAIHALLVNRDPERTFALAEELGPTARARLARFSPASVVDRVRMPVSLLHSVDDPAVPYGEALRLERDLPDARLFTVELFRHVDFRPEGAGEAIDIAVDLWHAWRFTGRLLSAQETPFSFLTGVQLRESRAPRSPGAGEASSRRVARPFPGRAAAMPGPAAVA